MIRKLLVLLALCAIGAIVAYWASGWEFNWTQFTASFSNVKAGWLAACIVMTFVTYWLRALRWQVLLKPLKPIPIASLLALTTVGFAIIFALGRAGEVARPVWLSRREKVPVSGSIATIVVERVIDMVLLMCLFAGALLIVQVPAGSENTLGVLKGTGWLISAGVISAIIVLVVIRTNAHRITALIPFRRVAALIDTFAQGLAFLQNRRSLASVLLLSVVLWVTIALQFWMLLLGMSFAFSFGAATLVMVGAGVGSIAQVPGIGGGFQAGYIFGMTALFQVPKEQAAATSLIAWAVSYGPTVAVAGIYLLTQGISMRELKSTIHKPESETV